MKKMTCSQMGGPCDMEITGSTPDEMIKNGMDHLVAVHPEMAEGMKNNTQEENDKWSAEFQEKWANTPEMPEQMAA